MRGYAREVSFSLVFEYLFTATKNDLSLDLFENKNLNDEDKVFVNFLYEGAIGNLDELKTVVSSLSKGFKLERIYKVDLAILILAIFELKSKQTPTAIAINEAVELAKKFSTEKSVGFVNGVLAEFAKSL